MKILVLGAAGFIGTNLIIRLAEEKTDNVIVAVDKHLSFFRMDKLSEYENVEFLESKLDVNTDFDALFDGIDIVYHLLSTTIPSTSNRQIPQEIEANIVFSAFMLDSCVRLNVRRVVFISSGGTVYGKEVKCPLHEEMPLKPITSYGLQKMTIENLLYIYSYIYGLDYRVIRLSNPYGPYQRPNGVLGVVTTFIYKTLLNEEIVVYGDGSVIRDFLYIDDVITAVLTIANSSNVKHPTFNVGCGYGISVSEVVQTIEKVLDVNVLVKYMEARKVDVPVNYLDISRYEKAFGKLHIITLQDGIKKTADFMCEEYGL